MPVPAGVAAEAGQAVDLVRPVGVPRLAELPHLAGRHDAQEHQLEPLAGERREVLADQLAMAAKQRRLPAPEVEIGGAGIDQPAEQVIQGPARLSQLGAAPAGDTARCRRSTHRHPGRRGAGPHLDQWAGGVPGERDRHLPARRPVAEAERLAAAETRGGIRVGHLARKGEDLDVGQRIPRERPRRTVGEERHRFTDGELQRVRALLVHHLDETIEPGHRHSQSRGRASRMRDLLKYQVTSSAPSSKKTLGAVEEIERPAAGRRQLRHRPARGTPRPPA